MHDRPPEYQTVSLGTQGDVLLTRCLAWEGLYIIKTFSCQFGEPGSRAVSKYTKRIRNDALQAYKKSDG